MKLYEKKFPIYEKCMTSIFGQPGQFQFFEHLFCLNHSQMGFDFAFRSAVFFCIINVSCD